MSRSDSEWRAARREVILACGAVLVLLGAGILATAAATKHELKYWSLFFDQFAAMEPPAMAIVALFTVAVLLVAVLSRRDEHDERDVLDERFTWPRWALPVLAAAVGLIVVTGLLVVFRNYYVADDEYASWLLAHVFARGRTQASVPPQWCPYIRAITPDEMVFPKSCTWGMRVLPVHSIIRAGFLRIHADWLAGAAIAAASILLMFSIARKLWPDRPAHAWLAVIIFATSTQFLFMSMTMFAMPTTLLLTLAWLWLYVHDRWWSIALLPAVSLTAFGTHSPVAHLLWLPPFVLRYAVQRRWTAFLYVAVGVFGALAFWTAHLGFAQSPSSATTVSAVASNVAAPARGVFSAVFTVLGNTRSNSTVNAMDMTLLATWSTPIVMIALILGLLSWASLNGVIRTCALSFLLIILGRGIVSALQGEGFGYRLAYESLGNLALVAVCGIETLVAAVGSMRASRLVVASIVATLLVQLPLRAWQVERFAAPWARTYRWLASQPADVVVFNPGDVMWGRQLLRNDPFFEQKPVLVSEPELPKDGLEKLRAQYPGRVRVVTKAELMQFGLERWPLMFGSLRVAE